MNGRFSLSVTLFYGQSTKGRNKGDTHDRQTKMQDSPEKEGCGHPKIQSRNNTKGDMREDGENTHAHTNIDQCI